MGNNNCSYFGTDKHYFLMRFETEQDLANELEVMRQFAKGHQFHKLGENDLDFTIPGKCFVEVKCINSSSTKYDVQIISLIKLVKMQERAKELPTFIVFRYTDAIKYINFKDINGYVRHSGREQREGAANDRELLLFVDRSKLIELK